MDINPASETSTLANLHELARQQDERSILARILEVNTRYAVASVGSFKRDTVVVEFGRHGELHTWPFDAFRRRLYHEAPVYFRDERNKEHKVGFATFWLKHPDATRYESLVFAPPGSERFVGPLDYNTWCGFSVEPCPGDWSQNRAHIRDVICAGNKEHFDWLLNWIAAMVQRPGQHGWVAPVLKGGQGVGKGHFAHEMLGRLFRPSNYAHLTAPEQLTNDFNSHLEDRSFVFADEAVWGDTRLANRLKGLITEPQILINRKHCPQEIQDSALHIIIASNADVPLPVERDDRRLLVLQVSDKYQKNTKYFNTLRLELQNGGRAAMLHDFLHYEVDWDLLHHPPESVAKRELKAASMGPEEIWWSEVLEAEEPAGWELPQSRSAVYARYSAWHERVKPRAQKKSPSGLGTWFARHFKQGGKSSWPRDGGKIQHPIEPEKRDRTWIFPPLAECRQVFDCATGTEHDWPKD